MGSTDLKSRKTINGITPVYIDGPAGTFGSIFVHQEVPQVQLDFVYNNISDLTCTSGTYGGGTVTAADGVATVKAGVVASSWASLKGRRGIKYRPGQGSLARLTAIFQTGVANNYQLAGIGNEECGYYFGYNGTDFGIFHISTAQMEIRTLTITTAATSGGTVTVTLDGTAVDVTVTANTSTAQTAYEISRGDFSQAGDVGFSACAVGSVVFFRSNQPRSTLTGTYSVSGGGVAGTFAQTKAGVDPTITFVAQSSWNIDKADGTGPSGFTVNPQLGNVYSIDYQYLGFGNADFWIENPDSGKLIQVHEIKNVNSRTTPVLKNPNSSVVVACQNVGNTSEVEVKTVSMAGFIEGYASKLDPKFSKGFDLDIGTLATFRPLAIVKTNLAFNNETCFGEIDFLKIGASNNTNNKTLRIALFRLAEVTGTSAAPVNFEYINNSTSITSIAVLDPDVNTISNLSSLEPLYQFVVGGNSATVIDLANINIVFGIGDPVLIAVQSDGAITGEVILNWFEQQ
jgi:hypothetical protein